MNKCPCMCIYIYIYQYTIYTPAQLSWELHHPPKKKQTNMESWDFLGPFFWVESLRFNSREPFVERRTIYSGWKFMIRAANAGNAHVKI